MGINLKEGYSKQKFDDASVLLAGGGAKAESTLEVKRATTADGVAWGNVSGRPLYWANLGLQTDSDATTWPTFGGITINNGGGSTNHINIGEARYRAVSSNALITSTNGILRFGTHDWSWNAWAGMKYVPDSHTLYLGAPDGSIFQANTAVTDGSLYFPGIKNTYMNGMLSLSGSIRNLENGGGIYWNPYIESSTDNSDAASITVQQGTGLGGTTLVIQQYNDANDTIQLKNSGADILHNSLCMLDSGNYNTYAPRKTATQDDSELLFHRIRSDNTQEANLYWTGFNYNFTGNRPLINGIEIATKSDTVSNADTVDGEHASAFAHIGAPNNLIHAGNEFTFAASAQSGNVWFNYRTAGGTNGSITQYYFGTGSGGVAKLHAGGFIHSSAESDDYFLTGNGGYAARSGYTKFVLSPIGTGGAPATDAETYWTNSVTSGSLVTAYNVPGTEYSMIFSKSTGDSGSILKWGYADNYMWMLRRTVNGWATTDWEKMSAGYADSAGKASTADLASQVSINYNNDSNSTYQILWGSGNSVYGTPSIYCNPATDYLFAASIVTGDWFRSTGSSGWYNATHDGGIWMNDSTIKTYGGKNFYCDKTILGGNEVNSNGAMSVGTNLNVAGNVLLGNHTTGSWGIFGWMADSDAWYIQGEAASSNSSGLRIGTWDDANEYIAISQGTTVSNDGNGCISGSITRTAYLLDSSGNTSFPGSLTMGNDIYIKHATSADMTYTNAISFRNLNKCQP